MGKQIGYNYTYEVNLPWRRFEPHLLLQLKSADLKSDNRHW